MTWRVINNTTGAVVEGDFLGPRSACRALWIFTAHEVKNGRVADYRIEPPVDLIPAEDLNLPDWVHKALENAKSPT